MRIVEVMKHIRKGVNNQAPGSLDITKDLPSLPPEFDDFTKCFFPIDEFHDERISLIFGIDIG